MDRYLLNKLISKKWDGITAQEQRFCRLFSMLQKQANALKSQLCYMKRQSSSVVLALIQSVQLQQRLTGPQKKLRLTQQLPEMRNQFTSSGIAVAQRVHSKASSQINSLFSTMQKKTEIIKTQSDTALSKLMLTDRLQQLRAKARQQLGLPPLASLPEIPTPSNLPAAILPAAVTESSARPVDVESATHNDPVTLVTPLFIQKKIAAPYFEHNNKAVVDIQATSPGPAIKALMHNSRKTQAKQRDNAKTRTSTRETAQTASKKSDMQTQLLKEIITKWGHEELLAIANDPKTSATTLDDLCYFVSTCRSSLAAGVDSLILKAIANNPNTLPALRKKYLE